MKKNTIIFWLATGFIFLFEGVMPAFFFGSAESKQGMSHLGYPEYFGNILAAFKVGGALILIIPQVPHRLKELAYAGFFFNFIFAFLSHIFVDGFSAMSCFPLVVLAILAVSYVYYHKISAQKAGQLT